VWLAIAVAMPAHFVVYVLLQNLVLDAVAWGLMALGFVVCAWSWSACRTTTGSSHHADASGD
jgi:hypothetical protein